MSEVPTSARTESDSGTTAASDPGRLTTDQQVAHYIDIWKQSVSVQMHFNDIEWRIRGLALTVATFALGAAAVAARDGAQIGGLSLGSLVLVIGLLLWYAFYFVDRVWYHPLLRGAVEQGTDIEAEIRKHLPRAGMTAKITERSAQPMPWVARKLTKRREMHSDDKLRWFYSVGALALGLAALGLQIGVSVSTAVVPDPGAPVPATSETAP